MRQIRMPQAVEDVLVVWQMKDFFHLELSIIGESI